jgi:cytochrome c553
MGGQGTLVNQLSIVWFLCEAEAGAVILQSHNQKSSCMFTACVGCFAHTDMSRPALSLSLISSMSSNS